MLQIDTLFEAMYPSLHQSLYISTYLITPKRYHAKANPSSDYRRPISFCCRDHWFKTKFILFKHTIGPYSYNITHMRQSVKPLPNLVRPQFFIRKPQSERLLIAHDACYANQSGKAPPPKRNEKVSLQSQRPL